MVERAVPTGRFEWERLVRRMTLPRPQKFLAFVLATYADPDGTRVRPGVEVLADVTCQSEKNVRRHLAELRGLQLIELVSRGGGRGGAGRTSEYRLTIPTDLLDRLVMLDPGERCNPTVSPDTEVSGQSGLSRVDGPVDNPESPDTQMTAQFGRVTPIDRTSNTVTKPIDRTFSPIDRTPRCPTTSHIHQPPRPPTLVTTQRNSRPRAHARPAPVHLAAARAAQCRGRPARAREPS
jgi:hypothetical protein